MLDTTEPPRRRRRAERTLLLIELREALTAISLHLLDWQADARLIYAKACRPAPSRTASELRSDIERLRSTVRRAKSALCEKTEQLSPKARSDSRVADRFRSLDCILQTLDMAETALRN